ncbi:MAG: hypothetical protein WCC66_01945 [Rhizobiaceae bacterium]
MPSTTRAKALKPKPEPAKPRRTPGKTKAGAAKAAATPPEFPVDVQAGAPAAAVVARSLDAPPSARTNRSAGTSIAVVSWLMLTAAIVFWLVGLPGIKQSELTDFGLVELLTWPIWVSLALLSAGFFLSLQPRTAATPLPQIYLFTLIGVLHLTPALSYEALRYSWTWKHLGIIDYIQRHGGVDPAISILPAYHNWPGLFLATAWIADIFRIGSVELASLVRFAPPVYNALFLLALIAIYRRLTRDPRLAACAGWVFIAGNWVGQDYFSPQATAFFLYLIVLALCLGPLRSARPWLANPAGWVKRSSAAFINFCSRGPDLDRPSARPGVRMASAVVVLALIAAINVTHQLTPIALVFSVALLALIGRLSFGYAVFAATVAVFWLLYGATSFVANNIAEELGVLGQGLLEASDRLIDTSIVSAGQVWVVQIGRATSAAIVLLAAIGGLRRLWAGYRDGPAIVLALAAFPMFANSYGGEILFRVYFFSLPFIAFFASAALFPTPAHGHSRLVPGFAACCAFLLCVGFLFANNGKDRQYTFSRDEVAVTRWLYETARPNTLLIEGGRSYPSQFLNYEFFQYVPIANESRDQRMEIVQDPVGVFARWLSDPKWSAGFVIITRSQKAYSDAEGVMPPGSIDKIEQALLASPRFRVVRESADARVFALDPVLGRMGDWVQ